jgi:hypothetical protein
MIYGLFGWWFRWQACKMAAISIQGQILNGDVCQRLWSATVFFEKYMLDGADGTAEDFGPKDPIVLKSVELK